MRLPRRRYRQLFLEPGDERIPVSLSLEPFRIRVSIAGSEFQFGGPLLRFGNQLGRPLLGLRLQQGRLLAGLCRTPVSRQGFRRRVRGPGTRVQCGWTLYGATRRVQSH